MGLDSKELNIDLNCCFSSLKSFSDLLSEVSLIDDIPMKLSALDDYVYSLEQEQRKVDAFKRELPLSMILLNDAIAKLKEHALQLKRSVENEKVMPCVGNSDKEDGAEVSHKKTWMSSSQLWSTPLQYDSNFDAARVQDSVFLQAKYRENDEGITRRSPFKASNINKKRKGIVPFDDRNSGEIKKEVVENLAVDGLSLSMPVAEMVLDVDKSLEGKTVASYDLEISEGSSAEHQSKKKQRRCWSQELHQGFMNALLQLGGAQVATPKQIREIMRVDGLTNDEVKSHLQKYRLHIRKLQQPSPSIALPNVGYWLKREEYKDKAMPPSGSPEGPLHLGGSVRGILVTNGETIEEGEDIKSESQSLKGHFCKPSPV